MLRQGKTYLILFLLISAVVNGSHFFSFSKQTPIDFRNLYLGSRLWFEGRNPYNIEELQTEWALVCEEEYLAPEAQPGFAQNFLVYPPYALIFYAPFALLNWQAAIVLNFILMMVCIALIVYTVLRMQPVPGVQAKYRLLVLVAVILAMKGTAHAAIVGQPSFICIAAALLSYLSVQRNKKYLAPIFLIVASIKPTVALPIWIFLIIHKEWKTVLSAIGGIVILLSAVLLAYPDSMLILKSYLVNSIELRGMLYTHGSDYPYNYHMISGTQLQVIVELIAGSSQYRLWVSAVLLLAGTGYIYWKRNTTSRLYQLCILIVTGLLATYHLFYDTMLLLPVVALTGYTASKRTLWLFLACIPIFVPFNGILAHFPALQSLSFLYFSLPVSILFTGIWLLSFDANRLTEKQ